MCFGGWRNDGLVSGFVTRLALVWVGFGLGLGFVLDFMLGCGFGDWVRVWFGWGYNSGKMCMRCRRMFVEQLRSSVVDISEQDSSDQRSDHRTVGTVASHRPHHTGRHAMMLITQSFIIRCC